MKTKKCTKCGEVKNIDQYYKNKQCKGGINSYCIECEKKRHRKYYIKNSNAIKKKTQRYYKAHKTARRRKQKMHREWLKTHWKSIDKKLCPKCGITKDKSKFKRQAGTTNNISSWCKNCIHKKQKVYYLENSNRIKTKSRKYRKKQSAVLSEFHVKHAICGHHKELSHNDITQEMVVLKRKQLKIYRLIRDFERNYLCRQEPA